MADNPWFSAHLVIQGLDEAKARKHLQATQGLICRLHELVHEIRRKYTACEQELEDLRREYPQLLAKLEEKYRLACAGRLETKSRWPKRDARAIKYWGNVPTLSDLIDFAYEEDLDLFGEPKQFSHFPPPGEVPFPWD